MPMIMTPEQNDWFGRMRADWLRVMRPFAGYGVGQLFPALPTLPANRLEGCVLLPHREEILRRLPKGGVCAEVGTQEGLFAEKILDIVRPARLHLFDIDDAPLRARDTNLLAREEVELHLGDSSTLLGGFPDDHFDWIYIDGDHSYDGASRDARVARTKVKPGGLLIFNDFTLWSPAECMDYGVPHAVCELSVTHDFRFVYFALHPHLYNDVALRRPLPDEAAPPPAETP
ncbi:class I SAM-dependent methyltransferase [Roseomonas eburnea]|uniref:Class I SAM-dependent methyltransferase n=1 Tax=Neoroseomonas eburnea TaxID=1346889 RepID=A0A9X9X8C3_9PROT|nr:class I SAM-dependent methyltransferase [Neoroseomonas eburnea]MBR0679959.1 class I SAM-dependent methyltransferase [Neoroseomonas eburnea]